MSDQDFFFDEEDEAKSAPSTPDSTSGKGTKAKSSGAPQSSGASKGAAPAKSVTSGSAQAAPFFEQNVTLMVATMLMIIGVLVGFIIGFLVGGGTGTAPATTAVPEVTAPATNPGNLTQDQIDQGLPAGHPNIGDAAAESSETSAP